MAEPKNATKKGGSRYYEVEGLSVPSVTSVLDMLPKPALPRWAAKVAAEYAVDNVDGWSTLGEARVEPRNREDAIKLNKSSPWKQRDTKAGIGTAVHEALESYLNGKDDQEIVNELQRNQVGYFYGLLHFLDSVEPQVLKAEATVFSKTHGYAGTADIIGVIDGVRTVIDAKTSKACYTSHGAQIAAYANAEWIVEDDKLVPWAGCDAGMVVVVNEDGEFTATPFTDLAPWFDLFKAAYGVWETRELKVPKALRV